MFAQTPADPFPKPIPATEGVIRVNFVEFASLPDVDGEAARMMLLVNEPGTRRLFVNDMRGPLYSVSYDGKTVDAVLDINAPNWGVRVQSMGSERGFQSFAFHPQFNQAGTPRLRQVLHLHRHHEHDAAARLQPGTGGNETRTTRCCSSGPRRRPAPRPTTAARRAS